MSRPRRLPSGPLKSFSGAEGAIERTDRTASRKSEPRQADPVAMLRSERELVEAAQRGEASAIEALYRTHYDIVYKYVFLRVGCPHAAEDVTSQVFLGMVRNLGSFRWMGRPFLAWLYAIAQKQVAYHHRSAKSRPVVLDLDAAAHMIADTGGPHATLEQREERVRLVEAIRELPEGQREVLLLRHVLALPIAEVAGMLDKSEGAVKQLTLRGLSGLKDHLAEP